MWFNSSFLGVRRCRMKIGSKKKKKINKNKNRVKGHTCRNNRVFLCFSPPLHSPQSIPRSFWPLKFLPVLSSSPHMCHMSFLTWRKSSLFLLTLTYHIYLGQTDTPKVCANLKANYFPEAFLVSFRKRTLMAKSHLSSRYTHTCLNFLWIHGLSFILVAVAIITSDILQN